MQIIKTSTIRINLSATLATMLVGETWSIPASVSIPYLRVVSSQYGKAVNKSFTINAKMGEPATLTRTF